MPIVGLMQGSEHYRKKYELGVIDVSNSLEAYNRFLVNASELKPLGEFVSEALRTKQKVRVLDIGCGTAGTLHDLKQKFGKKIETVGIDLIAFPKKNADLGLIGDAFELEWPSGFDLVFSFRSLHEIGNARKLITKVSHCLAPGGVALLLFRLRNVVNQNIEWSGDMTETDELFLFEIGQTQKWEHCRVSSRVSFEELADGSQTPVGLLLKLKKK